VRVLSVHVRHRGIIHRSLYISSMVGLVFLCVTVIVLSLRLLIYPSFRGAGASCVGKSSSRGITGGKWNSPVFSWDASIDFLYPQLQTDLYLFFLSLSSILSLSLSLSLSFSLFLNFVCLLYFLSLLSHTFSLCITILLFIYLLLSSFYMRRVVLSASVGTVRRCRT
jgi:hypothetical protein